MVQLFFFVCALISPIVLYFRKFGCAYVTKLDSFNCPIIDWLNETLGILLVDHKVRYNNFKGKFELFLYFLVLFQKIWMCLQNNIVLNQLESLCLWLRIIFNA